ncbi:MAG: histidine--tRNA ligase [Eubacteriales bacterium]
MSIRAPKGTKDITIFDSYKWHYIEDVMRKQAAKFGFRESRTPVFESTELFLRGVGDTTDIVQKEMYTFQDKGNRSITLKPEGTAGTVRSFIENNLYANAQPTKMYYLNCPVFRYERPQAGRLREHHQFGVEVFGSAAATIDAEVINLAKSLLESLEIQGIALNINSIGCPVCRPAYHELLKDYLRDNLDKLCKTCNDRFETNPLRILDCKEEGCQTVVKDAPKMIDHLCEDCQNHFDELQQILNILKIEYTINPMIVRGLDYYTKTVFEFIATGIGAQGTVCGGGRYDGLVAEIGGPEMPGMGFGMGMERLLMVLESQGIEIPEPPLCEVFICTAGDEARMKAVEIVGALRHGGIKADMDHMGRSLKAQMKFANKCGAGHVVVMGEDELASGTIKLKDMREKQEIELTIEELVCALSK